MGWVGQIKLWYQQLPLAYMAMGMLYVKSRFQSQLNLFLSMRLKVQLSPLDLEFQKQGKRQVCCYLGQTKESTTSSSIPGSHQLPPSNLPHLFCLISLFHNKHRGSSSSSSQENLFCSSLVSNQVTQGFSFWASKALSLYFPPDISKSGLFSTSRKDLVSPRSSSTIEHPVLTLSALLLHDLKTKPSTLLLHNAKTKVLHDTKTASLLHWPRHADNALYGMAVLSFNMLFACRCVYPTPILIYWSTTKVKAWFFVVFVWNFYWKFDCDFKNI